MAKPRVHEIASEMGVPSKSALLALRDLGEFVKGPSSSIEPAVARKLRRALEGLPQEPGPFAVLDDPEGAGAVLSALRRGAAGVPDAIDLLAGSAETLQERALADYFDNGVLFFVPVDAAHAVREAGDSPMTLGFDELPAPRGFIVVMSSESQDRWEIMGWSVARPELQILPLLARVDSVGRLRVSHEKPRTLTGADSRWAALGARGRIIAGVYRTIPRRPAPSPATRHSPPPLGPQPGDGRVHVVAASRPPADLPGGSNSTDATPSQRTEPGFRRSGRWSVRGHWRRQWYARAGEHKRIWIADHTAGEPEGELRDRTMVYVVRGDGQVALEE